MTRSVHRVPDHHNPRLFLWSTTLLRTGRLEADVMVDREDRGEERPDPGEEKHYGIRKRCQPVVLAVTSFLRLGLAIELVILELST